MTEQDAAPAWTVDCSNAPVQWTNCHATVCQSPKPITCTKMHVCEQICAPALSAYCVGSRWLLRHRANLYCEAQVHKQPQASTKLRQQHLNKPSRACSDISEWHHAKAASTCLSGIDLSAAISAHNPVDHNPVDQGSSHVERCRCYLVADSCRLDSGFVGLLNRTRLPLNFCKSWCALPLTSHSHPSHVSY
jgi:hypothetical protein